MHEMNMRQNGYNTNSDMFGYPENHYTVPLEAIQEVQYVRGSAALQFGSQFGSTSGKISYYAFYDYRHGNGWRDEVAINYHPYYANFQYNFNSKGSLAFQFSRMDYVQQIAGGLDDAQFNKTINRLSVQETIFSLSSMCRRLLLIIICLREHICRLLRTAYLANAQRAVY